MERDPNLKGRMGRLVAFLARMTREGVGGGVARGLAADEATAVLVDPGGRAAAYFLTAASDPRYGEAGNGGNALSWKGLKVHKLKAGGTFDVKAWRALSGGAEYSISVERGMPSHDGGGGLSVYNE